VGVVFSRKDKHEFVARMEGGEGGKNACNPDLGQHITAAAEGRRARTGASQKIIGALKN